MEKKTNYDSPNSICAEHQQSEQTFYAENFHRTVNICQLPSRAIGWILIIGLHLRFINRVWINGKSDQKMLEFKFGDLRET